MPADGSGGKIPYGMTEVRRFDSDPRAPSFCVHEGQRASEREGELPACAIVVNRNQQSGGGEPQLLIADEC